MILRALVFIIAGYLSGSVLFFRVSTHLLGKQDALSGSRDHNPGTANAFLHGGALCGLLTLLGDLGKGILPIALYRLAGGDFETYPILSALVFAAPVLGHAFPLFYGFRGGKAIAVTFGCMLGLTPHLTPGLILAAVFILLSLVLRISPHFYRTLVTYLVSFLLLLGWGIFLDGEGGVVLGFCLTTALVLLKLHMSREKREKPKVKLLWMH